MVCKVRIIIVVFSQQINEHMNVLFIHVYRVGAQANCNLFWFSSQGWYLSWFCLGLVARVGA